MRIALEVFLLLTLVISVQSKRTQKTKAPVDLCTIPVVLLMDRSSCHPLQKLWVLRNGKCKEALQCLKGYSKNECQKNCLNRKTTKKPQIRRTTCRFPFGFKKEQEIKVVITTQEIKRNGEGFSDTTTIGTTTRITKRTRRTRRPRKTVC